MFSLEPEIERLRPILGDARAGLLLARERREVFSLYPELRLLAWGGAVLLAAAAGLVLKNNLERIGPVVLALMMGAAAALCYAVVWRRRGRAGLVDDYVLLLGALLLSGDVAFIETQFQFLRADWHRHFLLLSVLHAAGAYAYRSRTLLALSVTAFAAWLGVERTALESFGRDPVDLALRAVGCAVILLLWRAADRKLAPEKTPEFSPVFEHFAANLVLGAGLLLLSRDDLRVAGALMTMAAAGTVIAWGFRRRSESFVLYGFVYAVIAADVLLIDLLAGNEILGLLVIVVSTIGAIVSLFVIHSRFRSLPS